MQRDTPDSSVSSENRLSGASILSDTNDDILNNTQLPGTVNALAKFIWSSC